MVTVSAKRENEKVKNMINLGVSTREVKHISIINMRPLANVTGKSSGLAEPLR